MKAVILVAGASRRLLPFTEEVPKCLLEIGGKSILDQQLDAVEGLGISEAVIVTGYRREQVHAAIAKRGHSLRVATVVNHQFFDTNTAYSLWLARDHFSGDDILYFNGDVMFPQALPQRLLDSALPNPLAVEVKACGDEEVKVLVDDQGRVSQISKAVDTSAALGEFIGVARFDADFTPHFAAALDRIVASGDRTAYFEKALESLAAEHPLSSVEVTDLPCIEIDFPEDLENARELARQQGF